MQIVIEIDKYDIEWIKNGYSIPNELNLKITEAVLNGIVLEDTLKDFLEWYDLPFNDCFSKHTDEVIQEFMDYQKESTDEETSSD